MPASKALSGPLLVMATSLAMPLFTKMASP
jgi:hypothetical protein